MTSCSSAASPSKGATKTKAAPDDEPSTTSSSAAAMMHRKIRMTGSHLTASTASLTASTAADDENDHDASEDDNDSFTELVCRHHLRRSVRFHLEQQPAVQRHQCSATNGANTGNAVVRGRSLYDDGMSSEEKGDCDGSRTHGSTGREDVLVLGRTSSSGGEAGPSRHSGIRNEDLWYSKKEVQVQRHDVQRTIRSLRRHAHRVEGSAHLFLTSPSLPPPPSARREVTGDDDDAAAAAAAIESVGGDNRAAQEEDRSNRTEASDEQSLCYRGCERYYSLETRFMAQKMVVDAVLDAQARQRKERGSPPNAAAPADEKENNASQQDALRKVSEAISKPGKELARWHANLNAMQCHGFSVLSLSTDASQHETSKTKKKQKHSRAKSLHADHLWWEQAVLPSNPPPTTNGMQHVVRSIPPSTTSPLTSDDDSSETTDEGDRNDSAGRRHADTRIGSTKASPTAAAVVTPPAKNHRRSKSLPSPPTQWRFGSTTTSATTCCWAWTTRIYPPSAAVHNKAPSALASRRNRQFPSSAFLPFLRLTYTSESTTPLYSKRNRRDGGGEGFSSSSTTAGQGGPDNAPEEDTLKEDGAAASFRSTLQLAKSVLESSSSDNVNEDNGNDNGAPVLGGVGNGGNSDRELAKLGLEDDADGVQEYDDEGRQESPNGYAGANIGAADTDDNEDDYDVTLAWDRKAASVTVVDADEADDEEDESTTTTSVVQEHQTIAGGEKLADRSVDSDDAGDKREELHQQQLDETYMRMALQMAESVAEVAYPNPPVGAVLVDTSSGDVLGVGASERHYYQDAIRVCLQDAGLDVTPLRDWLVAWPADRALREALHAPTTTLYVTMEPSKERNGQAFPSLTNLIEQSGIRRVVIGCVDPVPDKSGKGAAALHASGIEVRLLPAESPVQQECHELVDEYRDLANSKLHGQARKHFELFGRPLGFLHCSVVDSDNVEAFQRAGNAFGTQFGGKTLSFRNFGSYEIAPPPEVIWAADDSMEASSAASSSQVAADSNDLISVDFEDEDYQGDWSDSTPMMPWYEQANAVVATFPRPGNGPTNDASLAARLNGLKWLATHGRRLPGCVERVLVMDATDFQDLPLTNAALAKHFPNSDIDVEAFWRGDDYDSSVPSRGGTIRRPTRVLLRRGAHAQARSAAEAAAIAASAAAQAAQTAAEALETGNAAQAAEAALEMERAANSHAQYIQSQLQTFQELRLQLEKLGVVVETIQGGEPVDMMKHLGDRNGYQIVVWRAGCWGDRGVKAILAGAFQWVSAHLAVDAVGGKFWQLMLAENAVQAACGPQSKVKVFADQEDISLEYCDNPDVDTDCNLLIAGRPVRHIRLDCRVALVDENRHREFVVGKTKKIDRKIIEEEAPWFL